LLTAFYSAHEFASAEKADRLAKIVSQLCDVLRRKRPAKGEIGVETLKVYCEASQMCDPLPALPSFTDIWEEFTTALREALDSTYSTLFSYPVALDGWVDLIDLLTASEPRFLAHVEFPERYVELVEKLFGCVQRELREEVDEEDLTNVATNVRRIADRIRRLGDLVKYEDGPVRSVIAQLHSHSDALRDQARDLDSEEEPPDDDYDRVIDYSNKEIEALFSDL
jgi:hypothetical protein